MKIYKHKAKAYAVLVRAGKYILSEDERENKKQELDNETLKQQNKAEELKIKKKLLQS